MLFVAGCKRTVSVNSHWAAEEIIVDGQDIDWRSGGLYYDEKTNTKIGIKNDAQSLYVCLICKNENIQRQILQKGFTLWVSQNKAKNKLWGFRYPVEADGPGDMRGSARPEGDRYIGTSNPEEAPSGDTEGGRGMERPEENFPGGREAAPAGEEPGGKDDQRFGSSNEFELLSSEDEPGRLVRSEDLSAQGIEGKYSQKQQGGLVYELKIPIKETEQTPYAAAASEKGDCLIGFVSEKTESMGMGGGGMNGGMGGGEMGRGGMGGGMGGMNFSDMDGGGMGGGETGRGGMGGGEMGRGGMGDSTAVSLELWAMIHLAAAPD